MRKKSLKSLHLNKKSIATFYAVGAGNTTTFITTHSVSWCNPDGLGCPSEFITACQPPDDTTSNQVDTTGSANCVPLSLLGNCGVESESCLGFC